MDRVIGLREVREVKLWGGDRGGIGQIRMYEFD